MFRLGYRPSMAACKMWCVTIHLKLDSPAKHSVHAAWALLSANKLCSTQKLVPQVFYVTVNESSCKYLL